MDEKIIKKNAVPVIAAMITALAFSFTGLPMDGNTSAEKMSNVYNGLGCMSLLAWILLLILYVKGWEGYRKYRNWQAHVLAVIFSAGMLLGTSYFTNGNWDFLFGAKKQILISAGCFIGFYIICDMGITYFWRIPEMEFFRKACGRIPAREEEVMWFRLAKISMIIGWTPFILAFLPGSIPADGFRQLDVFLGAMPLDNHHPWVLTMIMGGLLTLGKTIWCYNFGVFLIVIVFTSVEIWCYSAVVRYLYRWKAPKWILFGTVLLFAFVPIFGSYAQAVIKDGLYTAVITLYFAVYIDICHSFSKRKAVYLFLLGISVCLTRNNGIHLVLPSLILLFFFLVKGARKYAFIVAVCVFACYLGVEKGAAPALGVAPGSRCEMLSVPFQQTARYLREYPDDVTASEKKAINRILDYDVLAEKYNPELSDPVKITFRFRDNDDDPKLDGYMKDYFKAWFAMLRRHPGVYIQATLNNIYSYNDPFHMGRGQQGVYRFYIDKMYQKKAGIDVSYVGPKKIQYIFRLYDELWMRTWPGTYLKCRNVYMAYPVADGISYGEEAMEKNPDLCHTGAEYTDMSCFSCKRADPLYVAGNDYYADAVLVDSVAGTKNAFKLKKIHHFIKTSFIQNADRSP